MDEGLEGVVGGAQAVAEAAGGRAWDELRGMAERVGAAAPDIAVALILLVVFWVVARIVAWAVRRNLRRRDRENLGDVLGGLVFYAVMLFGALSGATIVFPSVEPADMLATLGIGSVAIGFAFKDILQNWLAGVLILLRRPFELGDWIGLGDVVGVVERIETRATFIRTFDNTRVLVPNADLFGDRVVVLTAYDAVRTDFDVAIGYGDDIAEAKSVLRGALGRVEGVLSDPEPVVMSWALEPSWVTLKARWWTRARDPLGPRDRAVEAIKTALDEAGIDMPFETQVHLLHDQTDEADGRRGEQREGWPARAGERAPRPVRETATIDAARTAAE